jgi:hypothetical protein
VTRFTSDGTVGKYNAATGSVISNSFISGLSFPWDAYVDNSGNLYISNNGGGTISKYNANTGALVSANFITAGLSQTHGLVEDSAGHLFAANFGSNTISEYNATTGALLNANFVSINTPLAVAVDGAGHLFVAAIAQGAGVNGLLMQTKLMVLAAVAVAVTGLGIASMQIMAGPQKPAIGRAKQSATKEAAKSNAKSNAEQPAKYKPIDPETIAAYEKLGAEYGGFDADLFADIVFLTGKEPAATRLQGFSFGRLRGGPFPKLPSGGPFPKLPRVQVSFGLDLARMQVTDAGLKELKDFKSLIYLDLSGTQVTDTGLKELKDLKNLATLKLFHTQVSDAGLKELKDFKKPQKT